MAATSATSSSLSLSGLASGIDWTSIVNELVTAESAPLTLMQDQETADQNLNAGYQSIGTKLTTLSNDLTNLSDPGFFGSRTTSVSNPSVATASAATGTAMGTYAFKVTTLATPSVQQGSTASGKLNSSNNVSSLVLGSAGFATPVTAGTFTINGQTVNVTTGETLQQVFTDINTATTGAVTGSYSSSTDEITLTSSSPITLGSATDTSNFLQAAELYNNGTGAITSASALGGVNLSNTLGNANLVGTISDGGSGNGAFTINGVTINFNATKDTVSNVLQRINSSAAGVSATYDSLNNRFDLTDTTPGNVGITLKDVTGNFLAATGLSAGTLQAGTNLQYSINGSGTLTSQTNTINAGAAGLTGLSITATGTGTTTVTVASDTATISTAISSFVTDYNAVQTYLSGQTAPTTNSSTGAVTPGLFTGNMDVENIMQGLRQAVGASPGTGTVSSLSDLGIASNGTDNTLSLSDTTALNSALTTNLTAVENLFTNSTTGIATTLKSYVNSVNGFNGVLATDENSVTNQVTTLSDSITNLQAKIANDKTQYTNEFTAMETAINSINQEKNYLNDYFSSSSANAAPTAAGSNLSSSSTSSSSSG